MHIEAYNIADLAALADDDAFWRQDTLPISKHRLLAQVHNPRSEPDDIGLVAAYADGSCRRLLAYIGIVPDLLFAHGKEEKVGWLSCWWVSPDCRGQGLGVRILSEGIGRCQGKGCSCNPGADAAKIMLATGMWSPLRDLEGMSAIVRCNTSSLLARRFSAARRLTPVLKLFDTAAAIPGGLRLRAHLRRRRRQGLYRVENLSVIDAETAAFIDAHRKPTELFRRGRAELDWIIRHPWVRPTPFDDCMSERYHFSATTRRFSYHPVKIHAAGRMAGFLLLKLRDETLTVPYAYFAPDAAALMVGAVVDHGIGLGAEMVTLFHPELVEAAYQERLPFFYRWRTSRRLFVTTALAADYAAYTSQDGDGDAAFT